LPPHAGPSGRVRGAYVPAIVRAGGLGEYLGKTELRLDASNTAIAYAHQSLALGAEYTDDAEMVRLKSDYQDQYGQ